MQAFEKQTTKSEIAGYREIIGERLRRTKKMKMVWHIFRTTTEQNTSTAKGKESVRKQKVNHMSDVKVSNGHMHGISLAP